MSIRSFFKGLNEWAKDASNPGAVVTGLDRHRAMTWDKQRERERKAEEFKKNERNKSAIKVKL